MKIHDGPTYKIVVVGEAGVGKSTLMLSFYNEQIALNLKPTVGAEFLSKKVRVSDSKSILLNLWDTAGSEKYRSVVKTFYRGSSAVIIVYSITKQSSFKNLQYWFNEAKQNSNNNSVIYIVGTHLDQQQSRQVERLELDKWAQQKNIDLVDEISAINLVDVNRVFDKLLKKLSNNVKLRQTQIKNLQNTKSFALDIQQKKVEQKKCCQSSN